MSNSLEERLQTHSNAFDGLLSLIPAKYYYDESTQDQWQQKKKSKDELKQRKRDKLDPDSNDFEGKLSAKEVMDNKAKTAEPVRLPQKLARGEKEKPQAHDEEKGDEKKDQDQKEEQREQNDDDDDDDEDVEIPDMDVDEDEDEDKGKEENGHESDGSKNDEDSIQIEFDDDGNEISGKDIPANKGDQNPVPNKSSANTPVESVEVKQPNQTKKKPLSEEEAKKKQENLKKLREKLASKINILKEKRKAPGSKGSAAPKSREQILQDRKRKAELKKQEKSKRKHDEIESESDESDDEDVEDNGEKDQDGNLVFGNIAFNDGTRMTSDLSHVRNGKKHKGPANKDIKAHLLRLEKQKQKLSKLTPEEQKSEQEKAKWNRLMNQAEGVKVKDDEKLLRKALKRKDRQKLRSEIEWKERQRVVKDTMSARSKKREENLKLKQENKGKKRKHQVKLRKFTGIVNNSKKQKGGKDGGKDGEKGGRGGKDGGRKGKEGPKKRAGFEGSAKSKKK